MTHAHLQGGVALLVVICIFGTVCAVARATPSSSVTSLPVPLTQSLGVVPPGQTSAGTHEIQIRVTAPAGYDIYMTAPNYFIDNVDESRTMPADRLYWRFADADDDSWRRVIPGEKTPVVTFKPEDSGSSHTYRIQYMAAPSWEDPPSVGHYALQLDYTIEGMADMYVAGVYPNPATVGEHVVFQCVPGFAIKEDVEVRIHDDANNTVYAHTFVREADERQIHYVWSGVLENGQVPLPGTYTFTITGSVTRLCGSGSFTLQPSPAVHSTYTEETRIDADETNGNETFQFLMEGRGSTAVGSWLALDMTLQNQNDSTVHDIHVTTRLPRGWHPVSSPGATSYVYSIDNLPAGSVWRETLYIYVTPDAEPGRIVSDVRVRTGDNTVSFPLAEQSFHVTPETDDWSQPSSSLVVKESANGLLTEIIPSRERLSLTALSQYHVVSNGNWHAWWGADAQGRLSVPYIVAGWPKTVRVIQSDTMHYPAVSLSTLRGAFAVTTDAGQTVMNNEHVASFSLGEWHVHTTAVVTTEPLGKSSWQLRVGRQSDLMFTWRQKSDEDGSLSAQWRWNVPFLEHDYNGIQFRTRWTTGDKPQVRLAWTRAMLGGTVQLSQSVVNPHETRLSWRGRIGGDGPRVRLDSMWQERVHSYGMSLAQQFATAVGTVELAGRWRTNASGQWQPRNTYVSWHPVEVWSWPDVYVVWQRGDTALRAAWLNETDIAADEFHVLQRFNEGKTTLQYVRQQYDVGGIKITFDRDAQSSQGEIKIHRHVNAARDINLRIGNFMSADTRHVHAEVHVFDEKTTWQWQGTLLREHEIRQTNQRFSWVHSDLFIGKQGRAGVYAGVRDTETIEPNEGLRTTVTFVGGWGEVEIIPQLMAGVEAAKWNNTSAVEYDAYVRYELKNNVWLQGGYRHIPSTVSLLAPENTQGGMYGRLMWAYYANW